METNIAKVSGLIITIFLIHAQAQSSCCTPVNNTGYCIPIRNCQSLLEMLESVRTSSKNVDYLRRSQCGHNEQGPKVCCPSEETSSGNSEEDSRNCVVNPRESYSLLPSECGESNSLNPTGTSLSRRIYGGEEADIGEYPWMALLEYTSQDEKEKASEKIRSACGGSLISQRYVLTAAHCIRSVPAPYKLTGVKLGEYNTDTEEDCVLDGKGGIVCADAPITIGVEEIIVHELYNSVGNKANDIALIRLAENVRFTKFINAICLPQNGYLPKKLVVSGWGKTGALKNSPVSNIKLKLALPLVEREECSRVYRVLLDKHLEESQICAGGEQEKDACKGDSGGPLQTNDTVNGRWQCVGIVSFGPQGCGDEGAPGVYTKVINFVPWILSKLEA